jgi:hypothetical protein
MAGTSTTDPNQHGSATGGMERGSSRATSPLVKCEQVWRELERASFAVIGYITPDGEPRSSGVVYGVDGRHLYVAVAPDGWKARHITNGHEVSVTVPVRRGGILSLLMPIPPATVSFHARATVHPPGTVNAGDVSKKLASLIPDGPQTATILELAPEGEFLLYGVGVPLLQMKNPIAARARVAVA